MEQTNNTIQHQKEPQPEETTKQSHWLVWLLIGLAFLFLVIIIILRGLCTDVWYIRMLGLQDKLCSSSASSLPSANRNGDPRLSLSGATLTVSTNTGNQSMVDLSSLLQPGATGPAGPAGANGFNGLNGSTGATGSTGPVGPAGPTDPCAGAGTYFCQGGNTYGTTAMLGTNDANNLVLETNALPAYQLDLNGNMQENKTAVIGGGALAVVNPNSYGNQTIGYAGLASPIVLDNSQFNRLEVNSNTSGFSGPVTMTDSDHNLGWVFGLDILGGPVPTTLTNSDFNMAFMSGVNITNSSALVGQYALSTISDSGNIMGSVLGSTITNSNNDIINSNCILSGCTFDSINQSIIGAQGLSSASGSSMSIMYLDRTNVSGANSSAIVTARSNVNTSFFSYVSGLDLNVSDIAETAILADNMTIGSGTILPSGPRYSFIGGSGSGGGASVNGVEYSSVMVRNSDLRDISGVFGYFNNGSTINNLTSAMVAADSSTITNSTGLYVVAIGSNVSDSNNIFGRLANTTITNANQIEGMMFSANLNNITNLTAFVDRSSIDGFNTGNGHYVVSNMTNVESIFGEVNLSTLTNTSHFFGESLTSDISDSTGLHGRFATSIIANSDSIDGIVSLGSNVSNSSNIDGIVVGSTVDTSSRLSGLYYTTDIVNSSELSGITDTVTLNNVDRSSLYALSSSITDTNNSIINTQSSTLSGLDHSILIGNNVTLADPGVGSYDYSFIGADSAGAINTRINSKGDNSWLNASGGNVGIGTNTPTSTAPSANLEVAGNIRVDGIGGGPSTNNVCVNGTNDLVLCSSSTRYKENVQELSLGLETLMQLKAVSYDWKEDGTHDLGFVAEDTAAISKLLATYNSQGEIQGVKYDKLTAVITNAVQQQQGKIEDINKQLAGQGLSLDSLSNSMKILADRVEALETQVGSNQKALEAKLEAQQAEIDLLKKSLHTTTKP